MFGRRDLLLPAALDDGRQWHDGRELPADLVDPAARRLVEKVLRSTHGVIVKKYGKVPQAIWRQILLRAAEVGKHPRAPFLYLDFSEELVDLYMNQDTGLVQDDPTEFYRRVVNELLLGLEAASEYPQDKVAEMRRLFHEDFRRIFEVLSDREKLRREIDIECGKKASIPLLDAEWPFATNLDTFHKLVTPENIARPHIFIDFSFLPVFPKGAVDVMAWRSRNGEEQVVNNAARFTFLAKACAELIYHIKQDYHNHNVSVGLPGWVFEVQRGLSQVPGFSSNWCFRYEIDSFLYDQFEI
jgi:hypothetical protein